MTYFYNTDQPYNDCQIPGLPFIYEKYFGHKTDGVYVEVGAFDGKHWSNTYALAKLGWRGLLFEPQPRMAQECRFTYQDNPLITVEECAVGNFTGVARLYTGGSISTTVPAMIDIFNGVPELKMIGMSHNKFIHVPFTTLNAALEKHDYPHDFDLLVVDVEGAELEVLEGLDLSIWQPRMMILEVNQGHKDPRLSVRADRAWDMISPYGYSIVFHDIQNTIYWKEV